MVGISLITPYNNHYVGNTYLASNHLPLGPLFVLICLIGFNVWAGPRLRLKSAELAGIWCMMIVTASIPSKAFAEYLLPGLVGPEYFATPENEWRELFHAYIPGWLAPKGTIVARDFYEGNADGSVPWAQWGMPLLVWTLYGLALYGTMVCLSLLLRKQWIAHERLVFPLAQIPAELIGQPTDDAPLPGLFKRPIMWLAFAAAGLLHLINGLHFYFPVVPVIPTQFSLDPLLVDKPWSAMRPLPLQLHLSVIGVTYLLSAQVSLSLWFFYLFYKGQCLIGSMLGLPMPAAPGEFGFTRSFASHQEMGAFLVIICLIIWRARKHLQTVAGGFFNPAPATANLSTAADERWALPGLLGTLLCQVLLAWTMGISLWVVLFVSLFAAVMWVIFTWQVASAGVLIVHPTFRPMMMLRTMVGDRAIGARNLTLNTFAARGFRTDLTQLTMPHVMNGLKLADEEKVRRIPLLIAMLAAIVIALPVSTYAFLKFLTQLALTRLGFLGSETLTFESWNLDSFTPPT